MDIDSLAWGLANMRAEINEAERPIDKRLALAHFNGMCEAAHRLGLGMSPDNVKSAVIIATRDITVRPGAANKQRRAWHDVWTATVRRAILPLVPTKTD